MADETTAEFLKPIREWAEMLKKSYDDDGSKAGYFLCRGDWLRLLALATRGAQVPDGFVLVPRTPTKQMLIEGEGITDLILPEPFENTQTERMKDILDAWYQMIECYERQSRAMFQSAQKEPKP